MNNLIFKQSIIFILFIFSCQPNEFDKVKDNDEALKGEMDGATVSQIETRINSDKSSMSMTTIGSNVSIIFWDKNSNSIDSLFFIFLKDKEVEQIKYEQVDAITRLRSGYLVYVPDNSYYFGVKSDSIALDEVMVNNYSSVIGISKYPAIDPVAFGLTEMSGRYSKIIHLHRLLK
jgi:hypothetical protein